MAFENKVFKKFFDDLYESKQSNNHLKLRVRVLANGEEIYVAEPKGLRVLRDYVNSIYDITTIKCAVPVTTYLDKIYPNKLKLDVEIKFVTTDYRGEDIKAPEHWVRKYRAVLADPVDPETIQADRNESAGYEKGMTAMSTFNLQLIDKYAYEMQYVECGGIYPSTKTDDLIRMQLSYRLQKKEKRKPLINKDFEEIRGVDIVPADNTANRMLFLPYGTRIVDVPFFLQKEFGVYNTDISSYYQMNYTTDNYYQSAKGGWWFVYPLYNFKRFDSAPRTLTVYIFPEKEIIDPEKSFTYYDKHLSVMATGKTAAADYSEYVFYEKGNGVVFSKSSELLDTLTRTENHRVFTQTSETKRSFITKERREQYNDIRPVPGHYTENPYKYASELSKNNLKIITLQWSNSMPDLLIPGMSTKICYLKEQQVVEKYATLLKVDIAYKKSKVNMADDVFTIHSILTFAVELNEE